MSSMGLHRHVCVPLLPLQAIQDEARMTAEERDAAQKRLRNLERLILRAPPGGLARRKSWRVKGEAGGCRRPRAAFAGTICWGVILALHSNGWTPPAAAAAAAGSLWHPHLTPWTAAAAAAAATCDTRTKPLPLLLVTPALSRCCCL